MPEAVKREITLRTVLAPEALSVRADPTHMQQVIINLVMNGMDAMEGAPAPHNLTIRTRRNAESDFAEVRISDSGTGIRQENLTQIFDPFVTTKPQGTGLGLPIARTIIESYGGGPVGLDTIATSVAEEPETVEDVHEPFLIQCGLLARTSRGRVATDPAYRHLGLEAPGQQRLF